MARTVECLITVVGFALLLVGWAAAGQREEALARWEEAEWDANTVIYSVFLLDNLKQKATKLQTKADKRSRSSNLPYQKLLAIQDAVAEVVRTKAVVGGLDAEQAQGIANEFLALVGSRKQSIGRKTIAISIIDGYRDELMQKTAEYRGRMAQFVDFDAAIKNLEALLK